MSLEGKYESVTLEEYEPQLKSCENCFCGMCVESCPVYRELHNEAVSARGLSQIALGLLSGELELAEVPDVVVYACTECRWCEAICSMNTPIFIQTQGTRKTKVSGATVVEILRSMKIQEGGRVPIEIKNALTSLVKYGNPYGVSEKLKDDWIAGLGLTSDDSNTVFYVGGTVPYDDNSKKMAEAIIAVLRAGQLDFTMFRSEDRDSGTFARMMGEEWLFSEMVEQNLKAFKEHAIRRVICLSPHDYDAFIHYYEDMDDIEVKHYTQVISEMIEDGRIAFKKNLDKTVTYQDPCYLGRRNNIYDEPRKILQSIPGVKLVEMERSRDTTLCCGGGGVGLVMELGNVKVDRTRADQIKEVNPDAVVVACPNCYQMLDGALKGRNYDIEVTDIAQLVREAL
jgi:Fe-S oxidoreductase